MHCVTPKTLKEEYNFQKNNWAVPEFAASALEVYGGYNDFPPNIKKLHGNCGDSINNDNVWADFHF